MSCLQVPQRHPMSIRVKRQRWLPSGVLVVVGAGLDAAVQDADEPVRELPQRGVVAALPGPERVVVRLCAGRCTERGERLLVERVASRRLVAYRAMTIVFLPEARVIGLCPE